MSIFRPRYRDIRSRAAFTVYSANGDYGKFIDALNKSPIQFYSLNIRRGRLSGFIRCSDINRLTALAEEQHLTVEIAAKKGLYYVTRGYHLRFGAVIGFILAIFMTGFFSDRTAVIEIGGCVNIPEQRILDHLKSEGIYIGSDLSKTDLRAAERHILIMDKDIAWIGIRRTGSRVLAEIQEIDTKPPMTDSAAPRNIIAARDAQIKSVRILQGQLIPIVGDGVKKGDILVSGVVDTKYGRNYYVHSQGQITGVYTEKMTFSAELCSEERICTGEIEKKALSLFGKRFVYFSEGDTPSDHEYYEEEFPLKIGKIVLPVSIVEMHYRAMETAEISRTEDEVRALLTEREERYEKDLLTDDAVITDKEVSENCEGNVMTHTVTYTLEGEIGTPQQIFARYEGWSDP